MKQVILAVVISTFAMGSAMAMSKDGKPLAGAAKDSFMKKCESDA